MMRSSDRKTIKEKRHPLVDPRQIHTGMRVVCARATRFAIVEQIHAPDAIKLQRDENGVHHYIPLSWVTHVDEEVHLDRPRELVVRDWTTQP